jgi:hypothetical protein
MQHAIGTAASAAPNFKITSLHSMQTNSFRRVSQLASTLTLLAALAVALPQGAQAAGGSKSGGGGGGSTPKVVESVVTGYVTAIDYSAGTISIGASYYGSGALKVTSATKYSFLTSSGGFTDIKVGDWAEARYVWSTKEATKISITSVSP